MGSASHLVRSARWARVGAAGSEVMSVGGGECRSCPWGAGVMRGLARLMRWCLVILVAWRVTRWRWDVTPSLDIVDYGRICVFCCYL